MSLVIVANFSFFSDNSTLEEIDHVGDTRLKKRAVIEEFIIENYKDTMSNINDLHRFLVVMYTTDAVSKIMYVYYDCYSRKSFQHSRLLYWFTRGLH